MNNQLAKLIRARGLTHAELARLIGMSPSSFSHKINDAREWKASELNKLCGELGIESGELGLYFFNRKVSTTKQKGEQNEKNDD